MPREKNRPRFPAETYPTNRLTDEESVIPLDERLGQFIGLLEFLAENSFVFSAHEFSLILEDVRKENPDNKIKHLDFFLDYYRLVLDGSTLEETALVIKSITAMFDSSELPYMIVEKLYRLHMYCLGRLDALAQQ